MLRTYPKANVDVVQSDDSLFIIPRDEDSANLLELFSDAILIQRRHGTEITEGHKLVLELKR